MKILLVIAHFFKAEDKPRHSSNNAARLDARRRAIEETLLSWRASCGEVASINIEHKKFEILPEAAHQLDILVLINEENHLLTNELVNKYEIKRVSVKTDQPKLLPFAAHRVMVQHLESYDWFVYSEDDLAMRDRFFFDKQMDFQERFGSGRVLQPHRYEINANGVRPKTFIDGDLRRSFIDPYLKLIAENTDRLQSQYGQSIIEFSRARNPHSGFFALTADQMKHWVTQPHFMDMDCSFVSPLESAASLGLLKTFSVFKPASPCLGFLEIEHLDKSFSGLPLETLR